MIKKPKIKKIKPKKKPKEKVGRKLFDGKEEKEVTLKLEQAFALGSTVKEAMFYAEISKNMYYEFIKRNPEFSERIETLKQKPILKARQTVVNDLERPEGARWYLERKMRKEFGANIKIEDDDTARKQVRELKDIMVKTMFKGMNIPALKEIEEREKKAKK